MLKILAFALLSLSSVAMADVRIDIHNDSSQDCSVAINARTDTTTWKTVGWYVFMSNESAPIIVEGAKNTDDIFIYHDCGMKYDDKSEKKEVWVKKNLQFADDIPRDNEIGYEKQVFVRLLDPKYTIK